METTTVRHIPPSKLFRIVAESIASLFVCSMIYAVALTYCLSFYATGMVSVWVLYMEA